MEQEVDRVCEEEGEEGGERRRRGRGRDEGSGKQGKRSERGRGRLKKGEKGNFVHIQMVSWEGT